MSTELLYRRRLITQINSARDNVIYIHAPSGYGKTVLAQQWAETSDFPTVWHAGSAVHDAREILKLLIDTAIDVIPELKKTLTKFLSVKSVDNAVLDKVLDELKSSNIRFNIVIDDAEIIRTHHREFARHLVKNMPPNIRLLLLTETPPRISFIQESGAERFSFIGPGDLNFALDEIDQYAKQLKITQSTHDLQIILEITQGWPIGIDVALMQLAVHGDFPGLISSIKGKNLDRFSMVAQRVLAHLSPEDLRLLTELAVFESIDSEVIQNIASSPDAIKRLTILSQDSLVLSQTEFNPPAFRIHPLLRKSLVHEFLALDEFHIRVERVLNFLQEHEHIEELIAVLLELGQTQRLREISKNPTLRSLIERGIQDSVDQCSVQKLINWRDLAAILPSEDFRLSLMITFYLSLHEGNSADCQLQIQEIKKQKDSPNESSLHERNLLSNSLQAILDFKLGKITSSFELTRQCLTDSIQNNVKPTEHQVRALYVALIGSVMIDDDAQVHAIGNLLNTPAFDELKLSGEPRIAEIQALIAAHQGKLIEAQNQLLHSVLGDKSRGCGIFSSVATYIVEAMVQSEAGEHQKGLEILELALNLTRVAKNFPVVIYIMGRLAYQRVLLGETEEASALLLEARDLIENQNLSSELHDVLDIWEIRVRYWLVDHERVRDLIKRSNRSYLVRAFEAGMLINSDTPKKALTIVDTFDLTIPRQLLTYHLFRAHIFADSPRAQLDEVKAAVEIGAKHGYFNHFLTQRSDVIAQYISLVADSPTVFHENLAKAAGERLNAMMLGKSQSGESLTRREADILRHLATSLSLNEIASSLCISHNTIKTHCKSIYRKLDAKNRDDAVAKGKKLFKI